MTTPTTITIHSTSLIFMPGFCQWLSAMAESDFERAFSLAVVTFPTLPSWALHLLLKGDFENLPEGRKHGDSIQIHHPDSA